MSSDISSILVNVNKFPLSGPDNLPSPHYGLFREDTGECVGMACKKNYVPHTGDDVMAIFESVQEVFGDCSVQASFKDGHYLYLGPTKAERRVISSLQNLKYPDGIFPRLRVRAGYDGKAFSLSMGFFRDLCSNLARLREVKSVNTVIRHTSGLRLKMNELIEQMSALKNGWETLGEHIDRMASVNVNFDSFLRNIVGNIPESEGSARTRYVTRVEDIFKRVVREHTIMGLPLPTEENGFQVSAWEAFNAVQGYVQHGKSRRKIGGIDASQLDRVILADDDSLVLSAEHLANQLVLAS